MAWTDPKTWVTQTVLEAADLNVNVRDNLNALKTPPTDSQIADEGSVYITTSTAFVDVDSAGDPDFSLTITTTGGDVLIGFAGSTSNATVAGAETYLDVHESVGAARLAGDDGIILTSVPATTESYGISFVWLATGLAVGEHTFKLQWKVSAGSGRIWNGSSGKDIHPQFWVREV